MADLTPTAAPPLQEALGDGAAEAIPTAPEVPASASQTEVPPVTAPTLRPRVEEPKGKVARVADQAKGIVEDTKEWVELRLALAKQEVRDEVEARIRPYREKAETLQVLAKDEVATPLGIAIVFGLLCASLFLITLSFAFAALYVWQFASLHAGLLLGFLTTTTLLGLIALVAAIRFKRAKAAVTSASAETSSDS